MASSIDHLIQHATDCDDDRRTNGTSLLSPPWAKRSGRAWGDIAARVHTIVRVSLEMSQERRQAGRTTDAITLQEKELADATRLLGDEHPHTLAAVDTLRSRKEIS